MSPKIIDQKNPLSEAIAEINNNFKKVSTTVKNTDGIVDIMVFCNDPKYLDLPGNNFRLWPAQIIILKCFYMGTRGNEDLKLSKEEWEWLYANQEDEEREGVIYQKNIKDVIKKMQKKEKDGFNFRELNLVMGRRSSKTILASIITAYEVYKLLVIGGGDPHKYYNLPYDDEIAIINVALSQDQAGRLFGQIQARLRNSPFFKGRIAKETTREIKLYTDADLRKKTKETNLTVPGSILILCGHSNPDTLAGYNAILILFDELAFYDNEGKVTGKYFYSRLAPSLTHFMQFGEGKLVQISSPSKASGIFYEIHQESKKYDEILSLQLPTWCINPGVDFNHPDLKRARTSNIDLFSVEYGAQWAKSGLFGNYFPEGLIERAIRGDIFEQDRPYPGLNYHLHVDPANCGDRYVYVLVAKTYYENMRGTRRPRVILSKIKIYEPMPGVGLIFNQIDKDIIQLCSVFHPMTVTYDAWNSVQSIQLLKSHGINCIQTSYNRGFKQKIYQNLKDMLSYPEGPELWLYDDPRLIAEMKALKFRPTMRGISLVTDKHGDIKTDDLVDCLAGATAMASESLRAPLPLTTTMYIPGFV